MYTSQPIMSNPSTGQENYICMPCNKVFIDKAVFDHHRMSHEIHNGNQPVTSIHMANPNATLPSTCTTMGIPTTNKDISTVNNPVPSTGPFAMGTVESGSGYFNVNTTGFSTIASTASEQKQLLQVHTMPPLVKPEPKAEAEISSTDLKESAKLVRVSGIMKAHPCDECDKSYKRRDHLNRHKLIHTGVKPYSCEDCGKAFFRKDKLQRHAQVHDKSPPVMYNCVVCGKVFTRKERLNRHQKKMHKNVYSEMKPAVSQS